jgi:hypothetical protein
MPIVIPSHFNFPMHHYTAQLIPPSTQKPRVNKYPTPDLVLKQMQEALHKGKPAPIATKVQGATAPHVPDRPQPISSPPSYATVLSSPPRQLSPTPAPRPSKTKSGAAPKTVNTMAPTDPHVNPTRHAHTTFLLPKNLAPWGGAILFIRNLRQQIAPLTFKAATRADNTWVINSHSPTTSGKLASMSVMHSNYVNKLQPLSLIPDCTLFRFSITPVPHHIRPYHITSYSIPPVLTARRCTTKNGTPTGAFDCIAKSYTPIVTINNLAVYTTTPWVESPTRCLNCQFPGHHQTTCKLAPACAICAGSHSSTVCIGKGIKNIKCARCQSKSHTAFAKSCPYLTRWIATRVKMAKTPNPIQQAPQVQPEAPRPSTHKPKSNRKPNAPLVLSQPILDIPTPTVAPDNIASISPKVNTVIKETHTCPPADPPVLKLGERDANIALNAMLLYIDKQQKHGLPATMILHHALNMASKEIDKSTLDHVRRVLYDKLQFWSVGPGALDVNVEIPFDSDHTSAISSLDTTGWIQPSTFWTDPQHPPQNESLTTHLPTPPFLELNPPKENKTPSWSPTATLNQLCNSQPTSYQPCHTSPHSPTKHISPLPSSPISPLSSLIHPSLHTSPHSSIHTHTSPHHLSTTHTSPHLYSTDTHISSHSTPSDPSSSPSPKSTYSPHSGSISWHSSPEFPVQDISQISRFATETARNAMACMHSRTPIPSINSDISPTLEPHSLDFNDSNCSNVDSHRDVSEYKEVHPVVSPVTLLSQTPFPSISSFASPPLEMHSIKIHSIQYYDTQNEQPTQASTDTLGCSLNLPSLYTVVDSHVPNAQASPGVDSDSSPYFRKLRLLDGSSRRSRTSVRSKPVRSSRRKRVSKPRNTTPTN